MQGDWTVWQICDSAFPAGALAHSGGLEAAWQAGEIADSSDLSSWAETMLRQAAAGAVPLVSAAWSAPETLESLDSLCETFLLNHVAHLCQPRPGSSLFDGVLEGVRFARGLGSGRNGAPAAVGRPLGPGIRAACRALEVPRGRTCELFLFLALRGAVSAAVRLGIVGPLQGQNLQHRLARPLTDLARKYIEVSPELIVQTAPLADLLQGAQDRLYSRLFIS